MVVSRSLDTTLHNHQTMLGARPYRRAVHDSLTKMKKMKDGEDAEVPPFGLFAESVHAHDSLVTLKTSKDWEEDVAVGRCELTPG